MVKITKIKPSWPSPDAEIIEMNVVLGRPNGINKIFKTLTGSI